MTKELGAFTAGETDPVSAETKYARTCCEHGVSFNRPEPCADCECEDHLDAWAKPKGAPDA